MAFFDPFVASSLILISFSWWWVVCVGIVGFISWKLTGSYLVYRARRLQTRIHAQKLQQLARAFLGKIDALDPADASFYDEIYRLVRTFLEELSHIPHARSYTSTELRQHSSDTHIHMLEDMLVKIRYTPYESDHIQRAQIKQIARTIIAQFSSR